MPVLLVPPSLDHAIQGPIANEASPTPRFDCVPGHPEELSEGEAVVLAQLARRQPDVEGPAGHGPGYAEERRCATLLHLAEEVPMDEVRVLDDLAIVQHGARRDPHGLQALHQVVMLPALCPAGDERVNLVPLSGASEGPSVAPVGRNLW